MSDFLIENNQLKKYIGHDNHVEIPGGVTSIATGAFSGCIGLTNITIPDSVTIISNYVFSDCENLTSVSLPNGVKSIGDYAFKNCQRLPSIILPNSLTSIGNSAFKNCQKMTNITLPDNVTSIGDSAFAWCKSLTNITIPGSVTIISSYAFFACQNLSCMTILNGVKSIGYSAFKNCYNLTNVTIPDSVISIGDSVFSDCKKLINLTIPDNVKSIGSSAFKNCEGLTSIKIPNSVTYIGDSAFQGCSLSKIIIQGNDILIGKHAFTTGKYIKTLFVESQIKLKKEMIRYFGPIITNNPLMLPNDMQLQAVIRFAEEEDMDKTSERSIKHLKYIKRNSTKLIEEAFKHPALLQLMLDNKLLTSETIDLYIETAQQCNNTILLAALLNYKGNRLSPDEKKKAVKDTEELQERIVDFMFNTETTEKMQGKTIALSGRLKTFTSRDEFKACIEACGVIFSEVLNAQTYLLITNTPDSNDTKNKKAIELGIQVITEAEFNDMIGRNPKV